jgi:uncharacterized iron-regulated protein
MVIARYPFILMMIMSVQMLTACGNALVQEQVVSPPGHETVDAPPVATASASLLDLNATKDIEALIPDLLTKRVIYIGETHDNYSHHMAQLEIITALRSAGVDLAIGMEMFQRPFSPHLDDYIAGAITEAEMLRKTEWYERWSYDYRHYRPILNFAKKHAIPIIALNTPREITGQVSQKGIESLSDQQRQQIPVDIDYSDSAYTERLRGVFMQHGEKADRNFERFLQVQLLWDEGMAERAARFLNDHPDKHLVVLAGSGHLMHGSGIPNRVERRVPVSSAIILPGGALRIEPEIADYVIFPQQISLPSAALIGIYMEKAEKGVRVSGVAAEGGANKAGVQKDDIILSFNGLNVMAPADLRIGLLDKRPGDHVKIEILRKGVLFGDKRETLDLILGE